MPITLLLAMQAAGMVVDYLGTQTQEKFASYGLKLQQAGIESQIEENRLQSEDQSLQALRKLRQDLGTQMAVYAARGTAMGAGTSVLSSQDLLKTYNEDERMRRMNLLTRENQLKGGQLISRLNQSADNTKLWQSFTQRSLQNFSTNINAWKQLAKNFGLTDIT